MKQNFILIYLILIGIVAVSCKEDMDKYQYSPSIGIAAGLLPDSVLTISFDAEKNISILDTINLDDTVRIVLQLNGYGFNLTKLSIDNSDNFSLIDIMRLDSLGAIITSNSDPFKHNYNFVQGVMGVVLPFNYIPGRVSDTDSIIVTLSSDIETKKNTTNRILRIPVKARTE